MRSRNFRVSSRGADALDPHRVEGIPKNEVVLLLHDLLRESGAQSLVGQREPTPLDGADIESGLELVREVLQTGGELLREQLLRTLVLDHQDRDGTRHGEWRVVDAGCKMQGEVDEPGGLAVPSERTEQRQRVTPDDRPPVDVCEQSFGPRSFERDELGSRERKRPPWNRH